MNYPQHTMDSLPRRSIDALASGALMASARLWFGAAVVGQLLFAAYVLVFYGGAVASGNLALWNKVLPRGYVPGDTLGNLAIGAHMLMAVIITLAGALQLVPQLRVRAPRFHRWNGRVYVAFAVIASLIGLYMVWVRGSLGSFAQHLAISLNAVLIMLCAFMAVRHARARELGAHRIWALRLFLVVSGVWFFRVGLTFWILVNKGPVGFDPVTFQGPFLVLLTFAQTLVPLAVLQLYLRAQRHASAALRLATAAGIAALTVAMGVGIFAAALMLWLPHM
jgi:hypothetical protein